MKKISSLLVLMFAMTSLSAQTVAKRELIDYSKIVYNVAGDLFITIGNDYEVRLEGDEEYIQNVTTENKKGTLSISQDRRYKPKNAKLAVYVTLPILSDLTLNTSGSVFIYGSLNQDKFNCKTTGSGNVSVSSLNVKQAKFALTSSGSVSITDKSSVNNLSVVLSGSGNFNGANASSANVAATVKASGSCDCDATKRLSATITGSGDIAYSGNPKISAKLNGSGKLRMK